MKPRFDQRVSGGLYLAMVGAAMLLGACGKGDSPVPGVAGEATSASSKSPAEPVAKGRRRSEPESDRQLDKMNGYTAGYNRLIGTFGLSETQEHYLADRIAKRKPTDSISITDGWIEGALGDLKKARALSAPGLEELDKSADVLIGALDPLVTQLKALEAYYNAKAYKEDNLARGKAEDPQVIARFEASQKAVRDFDEVLSREARKRDAVELARLKASGDQLGYNTKLALSQAERIVTLFKGDSGLRNAENYRAADPLIAELEKTLADQRKTYEAAKSQKPTPDSGHESTVGNLERFVGDYREMKQSKGAGELNAMMKQYNSAVESANRIRN